MLYYFHGSNIFTDDVYTTIPDPNNPIYTSESETYARIPPLPITVEAEINIPPSERNNYERLVFEVNHIYLSALKYENSLLLSA